MGEPATLLPLAAIIVASLSFIWAMFSSFRIAGREDIRGLRVELEKAKEDFDQCRREKIELQEQIIRLVNRITALEEKARPAR